MKKECKSFVLSAWEMRNGLMNKSETNCFRIFNSIADGIDGLTCDLYNEYILLQIFRDDVWENREEYIQSIINAASEKLPGLKGILLKNRLNVVSTSNIQETRRSQLVYGNAPERGYSVVQNGIQVTVDLMEGQSTGLFLDMREIRERLGNIYNDHGISSILNLFSYTGMFSVHAILNGVKNAVNVDLSKAVLQKARENYILNKIPVDDRDFIFGDAKKWIKNLVKKSRSFDMVILDPPTFSRHKKSNFSVKKDYSLLLNSIIGLHPKYALTCINSHQISREEYISYHPSKWRLIFLDHESSDFPTLSEHYLKAGLWECF